jgi:hypothetical protein
MAVRTKPDPNFERYGTAYKLTLKNRTQTLLRRFILQLILTNSGKQLMSYEGYDPVIWGLGNFMVETRVSKKGMINLNQLSLGWETKY